MHYRCALADACGKAGGCPGAVTGVQGAELLRVQRHNEEKLNDAFCTAAGVFLVFSVNMSGHFQGYARMASPVSRQQVGRARLIAPYGTCCLEVQERPQQAVLAG